MSASAIPSPRMASSSAAAVSGRNGSTASDPGRSGAGTCSARHAATAASVTAAIATAAAGAAHRRAARGPSTPRTGVRSHVITSAASR